VNRERPKKEPDAFDLWWEWAEKPLDRPLMIDGDIHTQ
jgi:hypothetical protein